MNSEICDSSENLRLAERAAAGDDQAFGEFFNRFRKHLRQFIELRLDDRIQARVDPSDILQETQIEVHRRLKDFLERKSMPLRIWLRQTAKEHLISAREKHLLAAKRSVAKEAIPNEKSSMMLARRFAADSLSPSQAFSRREQQQRVGQAISNLRNSDREILLMRNIEDLTFHEIAVSMGITAALARQRYGRAMLQLRRQLKSLESGDCD